LALPRLRVLPRIRVPLLDVTLPEVELPEFPPSIPKLDDRQLEALRYAVMDDVGDKIPVIGDILSDVAYREIVNLLTPEEYVRFLEYNKWLPSSLAVLKVFAERQ